MPCYWSSQFDLPAAKYYICAFVASVLLMTKPKRLYREVADQLAKAISDGLYGKGQRLPSERDLSAELGVSRATIREAMIALELAELVEIRTGAGIFVSQHRSKPNTKLAADIGPGPFELIEARAHFESEAAAIAAVRISEVELIELDQACKAMTACVAAGKNAEQEDQRFHQIIAKATRNSAVQGTVQQLWLYRTGMPMWRKLHEFIAQLANQDEWTNDSQTIIDHQRILNALRARDADAARQAMRAHLEHVRMALLKASELEVIDVNNLAAGQ